MKTASAAIAFLFAVCLAALLAACGDDEGGAPTAEPSPTPAGEEATAAPTTGKIAFDSSRDDNLEVYVVNADGSGLTNLSNNSAMDAAPAWSRDGSRIALNSTRDGNFDVYAMNADGSDQTNLTNNPAQDGSPAWSPDGMRIAFHSNRDGMLNLEIYLMNADGSDQTRLTDNPAMDTCPAWSS